MKLILKIAAALVLLFFLSVSSVAGWLYFHESDLPPTSQLRPFVPASRTAVQIQVCQESSSTVQALPISELGANVISAVTAAEGSPDPRSPLLARAADLASDGSPRGSRYSLQIARSLVCEGRNLQHSISELRLAIQIERHYTREEILTVYLNRLYLAPGTYGVENAAQRYFDKHAAQLSVDEAALIAALIRSPNRFSPVTHPDRAIQRRNFVIDEMVKIGAVRQDEADRAKAQDLHVKSNTNG